jgi:hypothetical protein
MMLVRASAAAIALAAPLGAEAAPSEALVEATSSRWTAAGDAIVTEARVRAADGSIATVIQLGGSRDGIGMRFSHLPEPLAPGDLVTLDGGAVRGVRRAAAGPLPAGGTARYGVQRTTRSLRPLLPASGCLAFSYDRAGTQRLEQDLEWEAIDRAFDAWSVAAESCAVLAFGRALEDGRPAARDGVSTVHFRDDRWCRPATEAEPELCFPPEVAAVTRVVFVDDPLDPADGVILETDIEINTADYTFVVGGEDLAALDLQSVATHEIGHALGLAHNCGTGTEAWPADHAGVEVPACDGAAPEVLDATMYYEVRAGDARAQTLEAVDREALCSTVRGAICNAAPTGGCAAGGGGSLLLALLALAGLRGRRRQ